MKAVKIILICVLSLAVFLYVLFPAGFGLYASFRRTKDVGQPPDGFGELKLTTEDGIQLAAWYKPPENGAAIVLLHGANSSRDSVRAYAQMLSDNGFGVLALDLRGHGESKGGGNSFGWNSARDIGAAVAYLREQTDVKAIGGLGLSMGGEALLGALSAFPELKAVATDGATQRSLGDYMVLPSRQGLVHSWTTRVMYAAARLFTGDTPPVRLIDSIRDAKETQLLLIAAGTIKSEEEYSDAFLEAAGARAELWVVPGAGHTGAYSLVGEEYEQRVTGFFNKTLIPA
jgi:pimeloyl-ACP methyl ester carboxylesterase